MCDSHLLSLRIPLRISFLHPFCSDVDLAFVSWNSFMAVLFPFLRLASCLLISSACDVCFVGFIFKKERGKRGSQSSAVDVQNSGTSLHALARGQAGPMHAPPLPSRAFSVGVELTSGSLWCRSAGVLSARRRAREISTRWAESSDFDLQLPARAGDSVYIWWQRWRRREGGGGDSQEGRWKPFGSTCFWMAAVSASVVVCALFVLLFILFLLVTVQYWGFAIISEVLCPVSLRHEFN